MSDLLPCKLCGCRADIIDENLLLPYIAYCRGCRTSTINYETYEEAEKAWNILMKDHKWIKCSDSLPDGDEYVLTYSKDHSPKIQVGFYSTFSKQWMRTSTAYPTHWCPLPRFPDE